jgi:hypothetical protein
MPKPVEVFLVRPEKLKRYTGALTQAKKENLEIALNELDKYGRAQVKMLQEMAPEKKGLFSQGFTYSIKKSGPKVGELRVNWYPKDRPKGLLDWIVFGTGIYGPRRHRIVPKAVYANEKLAKAGKKTKPIPGNKPKMLAWQGEGGEWIRAKSVRGMKPRNFVAQAWLAMSDARSDLYENIGKMIAERIFDRSNRGGTAR